MTPLARWMAETKTSVTAMAQQTGLSLASISKYCRGERVPKYEAREVIHRITGGVVGLANWPRKPVRKRTVSDGKAA